MDQISFKTAFRYLFWGYMTLWGCIFIPLALLNLLHVMPVTINGKYYYGVLSLVFLLLYLPLVSVISSGFNAAIFVLGVRMYHRYKDRNNGNRY